ncbi:hypothetical protein [Rhizobium sp. 768_B6_N1_8]|uniref:hypothetical protein n=1 Tax=unclassified Rhizobium TaxID=2613769 RepID=UPI003F2972DD
MLDQMFKQLIGVALFSQRKCHSHMRSSEEQIDPSEGFRPEFFLRCNKKILTIKLKSISFLGGYFKIVLNHPVIFGAGVERLRQNARSRIRPC